ncbi:hypothetical protein [Fibrella aquatilis]|uniref:Uncharacterized protein n=1 Tax=Fibrella aquatilis TaxID=2817059 RepID=A0A939JWC8_9BACT|nr:hypothetical protein [Fibrella aquatilis]MBO0931777.1 hypothetical protein [Fibrella aquatilis]
MNNAQKSIAGLFITALPLAYACKSPEVVYPIPANHVVLERGKSIATSTGIIVFVDTVNISICPKQAACFAPDNLFASVRLVRNQESRAVRLFAWFGSESSDRSANRSDSTSVQFNGQLYKVILKGEYVGETDLSRVGRALLQVSPL